MATVEKLRSELVRIEGSPLVAHFKAAPGATFKKDDFVKVDGSGQVTDGPAAGNNWGASDAVLGKALANAGVVDPVPVLLPTDNTIFYLPYNGTTATNLVGTTRALRQDTNGFPVVDTSTTNAKVVIVDLLDPAGTVNGRVGVKILDSARAIQG